MFYEKLVMLCAKKGISVRKMCAECDIASSAPTKWKNGSMPNMTTMFKLASYFGVDAEFFADDSYRDYDEWLLEVKGMTRAEVVRPNWTEEKAPTEKADALDEEFYSLARQLTPGQMQRVKDFMRGVLS